MKLKILAITFGSILAFPSFASTPRIDPENIEPNPTLHELRTAKALLSAIDVQDEERTQVSNALVRAEQTLLTMQEEKQTFMHRIIQSHEMALASYQNPIRKMSFLMSFFICESFIILTILILKNRSLKHALANRAANNTSKRTASTRSA
jgi:hypothetical protein